MLLHIGYQGVEEALARYEAGLGRVTLSQLCYTAFWASCGVLWSFLPLGSLRLQLGRYAAWAR